jgi:hypothetical protein
VLPWDIGVEQDRGYSLRMDDPNIVNKGLECVTEITKGGNMLLGMFDRLWIQPAATLKNAHAQADAYRIIEKAKWEVGADRAIFLERGLIRKLNRIVDQQTNVESTVVTAARLLTEADHPVEPEQDWTDNFIRHAENISDKEMQLLWAKILAQEAKSPGAFSKRTLNSVSELSKAEAELFGTLCCYALREIGPVILNFDDEIYTKNGLTYESLLKLSATGLIVLATVYDHAIVGLEETYGTAYFDRMLHLQKTGGTLCTGKVALTLSGRELMPIVMPEPVSGFFEYLTDKWNNLGLSWGPVSEEVLSRQKATRFSMEEVIAEFGKDDTRNKYS